MADIEVYDDIGLTDSATGSIPILLISVNDAVGVTDYRNVNQLLYISVNDAVGLTDGISRLLTSRHLIILLNDYVGGAAYSGFGQQYPVSKSFEWRTDRVAYDSGREQRNQIWSRPIRRWQINWQVMDEAARDRLIEVFHRSRGMLRTFLWRDRDDYRASNIQIATNGVTTQYQLEQTYFANEAETWGEDKKDIAPETVYAPVIYHSVGGLQTRTVLNPPAAANQFFLDDRDGMLIWKAANPPAAGTLSCTFEFYFRVRFDYDEHTDVMFTGDYWRAEGLTLVEVIQ